MTEHWKKFPFFDSSIVHTKPKVAISACLTGHKVRYDGASKSLDSVELFLKSHLNLISICPEVEAGMTIPRPAIQLIETQYGIKTLGRDDPSIDPTADLISFSHSSLRRHQQLLCGYILQSRSPSCGLDSTPVINAASGNISLGSGIQANYFRQQLPWLVCVEENQLSTEKQCMDMLLLLYICQDLQLGTQNSATTESESKLADIKPERWGKLHQHYLQLWTQNMWNRGRGGPLELELNLAALNKAFDNDDLHQYWTVFMSIALQQHLSSNYRVN